MTVKEIAAVAAKTTDSATQITVAKAARVFLGKAGVDYRALRLSH
jgi:hypothetical protein